MIDLLINLSYLVASVLFILGLKMMSSPKTAIQGNLLSSLGMLIAVLFTLLHQDILDYSWILIGLAIGSFIGLILAKKTPMTGMPEMVALLNGFGGLASLLVGWAVYHTNPSISSFIASTVFLSVFIGGITFTGSMVAWAKLSEKISGKPYLFSFQKLFNLSLLMSLIAFGVIYSLFPQNSYILLLLCIALSLVFGVTMILPIGGADMPVVVSLLNSYSGLAACATGFVIQNNILIVSGALVGASGIILTSIMCRAMNRSLSHVLFSGFGSVVESAAQQESQEVAAVSAKDAYLVLEAAKSVVFVPGYGLAVAQAQHALRELSSLLKDNGTEVKYAIHPVAGRMPGHMNVLLAEADVPYEDLVEMDDINRIIDNVDVCVVIGANDVVNLAARDEEKSLIYGMPIIEVDRAKNTFVLKRSMASGFSGVLNPLFFKENTKMLFGDAKKTLQELIEEF